MRNKLSIIFCLGFLFFPKNFSQAATREFFGGFDVKTSLVVNNTKALTDYFLLGSEEVNKDFCLLHREVEDCLKFARCPIAVGCTIGYSLSLTKKFGIALQGNVGHGNIVVFNILPDKYKKIKSGAGLKDTGVDNSKSKFKISTVNVGTGFFLKYDLVNSSLDFYDYGRNDWKLDCSLGFKSDWFFSRELWRIDKPLDEAKDKSQKKGIWSDDRINCWHPGLVVGFAFTASCNVGLGAEVTYYFRNLLIATEEIKNADLEWKNKHKYRDIINIGKYDTSCPFLQLNIRAFYDFAPFFNNHEAPSEIDIEKW
ncbi:MAG: hypothetical protein LBD32_01505 [Cytophagales bacterium]|jgi:hypothetical protein|nr:hypothetical protein [Cytophagales bacterium]